MGRGTAGAVPVGRIAWEASCLKLRTRGIMEEIPWNLNDTSTLEPQICRAAPRGRSE